MPSTDPYRHSTQPFKLSAYTHCRTAPAHTLMPWTLHDVRIRHCKATVASYRMLVSGTDAYRHSVRCCINSLADTSRIAHADVPCISHVHVARSLCILHIPARTSRAHHRHTRRHNARHCIATVASVRMPFSSTDAYRHSIENCQVQTPCV